MTESILVLSGVSEGQRVRFTRLAKRLRQVDVAAAAHVNCIDITRLENDRFVLPTIREKILRVLGLLEEANA